MPMPASRGAFKVRFTGFDTLWAVVSPLLALYARDAPILSLGGLADVALYCYLSIVCSLISFALFRVQEGMTPYFSVHDAIDICKSVVTAILLTAIVLFAITRLDGVPRSTLLIHALVLGTGLVTARTLARLLESRRTSRTRKTCVQENIIVIGANRLSSLYIRFLDAYSPNTHRIMAVLDNRPHMLGRSLEHVRVAGTNDDLETIISEFAWHGIRIDRVLVGSGQDGLAEDELALIKRVCTERAVELHSIPELVGLYQLRHDQVEASPAPSRPVPKLPPYFLFKRFFDLAAAIVIVVLFAPLWLCVALVVLSDVGSPVLFWQQRLGQGGLPFLVYKFRTLKAPFDSNGDPIPLQQRLSARGRLLRALRLDEIPQLLNVLVGDMSLIGPRPLLPEDQPANPALRLGVRPGITGWAQVRGGNAVNAQEKDALDEWYIRNASLWLDMKIAVLTVLFLFVGEQRSEKAIQAACESRNRLHSERPPAPPATKLESGFTRLSGVEG